MSDVQRAINTLLYQHGRWRLVVDGVDVSEHPDLSVVLHQDKWRAVTIYDRTNNEKLLVGIGVQNVELHTDRSVHDGKDTIGILLVVQNTRRVRISIEPADVTYSDDGMMASEEGFDDDGNPVTLISVDTSALMRRMLGRS